MFKLSKKPWLVSKEGEVVCLMFLYPGMVVLGAVIVFVTILSSDSLTWWAPWIYRVGGAFTGLAMLYYFALLISWWKRDGYIDAILAHSQRLKAQQEAEKDNA